ncbi:hypothetical protein Pmani_001875 [Petrolisthes manimaculis]|uniref:Uncharacterized protein n=1 Tax=Petrolisthes manimaculis TaxID=1843537 RepID=A0AAE1UR50_9EUCA|nr:hypothetical protein Pmani_001875 [Petrolisthes manimaculis]
MFSHVQKQRKPPRKIPQTDYTTETVIERIPTSSETQENTTIISQQEQYTTRGFTQDNTAEYCQYLTLLMVYFSQDVQKAD